MTLFKLYMVDSFLSIYHEYLHIYFLETNPANFEDTLYYAILTAIHAERRYDSTFLDIEDLIVINTDDALLICKKGKSQDVKEIVDYLKRKQMNDYL